MRMTKMAVLVAALGLLVGGPAVRMASAQDEKAAPAAVAAEAKKEAGEAKKEAGEATKEAEEAATAAARNARRGGMRGAMLPIAFWENEKVAPKLNLSDEQTGKLKASYATAKEKMAAIEPKMAEHRTKMQEAMRSGNRDEAAITKMREEMAPLRKQQDEIIAAHQKVVDGTLNDEQKATLKEALKELTPPAGQWQGRGGNRQPGAAQGEGRRPGGEGRPNREGGQEQQGKPGTQ